MPACDAKRETLDQRARVDATTVGRLAAHSSRICPQTSTSSVWS
jgi:hypothetical protein